MALNYIHYPLHEEVTASGGHYVISKELRVPFHKREVLVTVGYGIMDTTCCGMGGCSYATVHGFVLAWKSGHHPAGYPISSVEPIRDQALCEQIKRQLLQKETIQQVNFL